MIASRSEWGKPKADDRQAAALHTRAKVLLAHVAWLLQQKEIPEVGGIAMGADGFSQKFKIRSGVAVNVNVTPEEPARVGILIGTVPPSRYRVLAVGEDGKTDDISVLADRIASGISRLAAAIEVLPVPRAEDPTSVPRNDLSMGRAGGGSIQRTTRPDSGKTPQRFGEARTKNPDATGIVPPQVVADLTALMLRARSVDLASAAADKLRGAILAAKMSVPKTAVSVLARFRDDLVRIGSSSPKKERILVGMVKDADSILSALSSVGDVRDMKIVPSDQKETAVDRLRAVAKPESAYAGAASSSQRFVGARNRFPGITK